MPTPLPTYDPTNTGNRPGDGPLRAGGENAPGIATKADLPSTLSKAAERQQAVTTMVRHMWTGQEAMHRLGPVYLPQAPGEDATNYSKRLARSTWHNFYRRTIQGLVGLIFRRDPVLNDDVPAPIVEHWENIDLEGTHGDVFLRSIAEDAMNVGHALLLVEYPSTGGQRLNRAQEAPLRPYWVPIQKDNVLSWRTTVENGKRVLTQLVIRECNYVPSGSFGEVEQVRYRMFYRDETGVHFRLLAITEQNAVLEVESGDYPTQDEIPVAEIRTSGSTSLFESDPPMLDVAWLNLAHYQMWSDYAWSIHKTNVPLLFGAGMPPRINADGEPLPPLVVGPNTFMESQDPNAKLQYVSHDGAALGSTKTALDDLKSDIGSLGLQMLAPQKRSAETLGAKRLDKTTGDSALSVSARALQDGVERAMGFHARYLRLTDGGSVTINRDFEELLMEPQAMSAYAQLVAQGLPLDIALEALQQGGRIPEDVNLDELEMEMAANQAAKEAQAAQALQDQQAQAQADMQTAQAQAALAQPAA